MGIGAEDPGGAVLRRGRRARLIGALLLGAWSVYLAATAQFVPAAVIGFVAGLMGASYAAQTGDPAVRRGSFLIAGTLFFCSYLLAIFSFAGGACIGQDACDSRAIATNVALIALTIVTAAVAVGEILLAFHPSSSREALTHRLAVAAVGLLAVLYLVARVSLALSG
jgi:hypothetical protein